MRISDWSSDVCSSDLQHRHGHGEDRDVLYLRIGGDLFGALLTPLRALFEHHFEGDPEQHQPARDAERIKLDMERAKQLLTEQREQTGRAACRERGCPYV